MCIVEVYNEMGEYEKVYHRWKAFFSKGLIF